VRIRRLAGLAVSAAAAALSVGLVAPPVGAAAGGPVTTSAINNPTTFNDNFDTKATSPKKSLHLTKST